MLRFVLFLILIIVLAILLQLFKDKLQKKYYFGWLLLSAIICIGIYNAFDDSKAKNDYELLQAFNSGKNITCKEKSINNKSHNYNFGTEVFIDKIDKSKILLQDCRL